MIPSANGRVETVNSRVIIVLISTNNEDFVCMTDSDRRTNTDIKIRTIAPPTPSFYQNLRCRRTIFSVIASNFQCTTCNKSRPRQVPKVLLPFLVPMIGKLTMTENHPKVSCEVGAFRMFDHHLHFHQHKQPFCPTSILTFPVLLRLMAWSYLINSTGSTVPMMF